jgi:hypothetical protein
MLRLYRLSSVRLNSIFQLPDAMLAGTMRTAIKLAITHLHAVTDDQAPAMSTPGRQGMDRTFEAVKHVYLVPHHHFK